MSKTFVTIFEKLQNVHLTKDVGQIPYFMYKKFGYKSILVGHKIDNKYPYLKTEVEGLNLKLLPKFKIGRISLSIIIYLIFNAKRIDILNLYHHCTKTYIYAWLFKKLNSKGIVYLKSDLVAIGLNGYKSFVNPKYKIRNYLLNKVIKNIDIISMETSHTFNEINLIYYKYKEKFLYLPNGLNIYKAYSDVKLEEYALKENIIITVGRIGTYQKNNEILLEAISEIDLKNWKIYLIGPIQKEFNNYINEYYLKFPHLKNKVIFTGNIDNKRKLYDFYNRSKIFCLTSRDESFGLVYTEALAYGNYILSTDVGAVNDITDNQKYGRIFENAEGLAKNLLKLISNENVIYENYKQSVLFAESFFDWNNIIDKLEERINYIE